MTMAALPRHLSRDLSMGVGGARQFWLARCHDLIQVACTSDDQSQLDIYIPV
jgi:hypothetical protein